jgi:hypothetical protein
MFLPSRERQGNDRWYRLRLALFVVGTGCVLAGARAERRWAVWVGIGILLVAVAIRLVARRGADERPPVNGD